LDKLEKIDSRPLKNVWLKETGYIWELPLIQEDDEVVRFSQETGLPSRVASMLLRRTGRDPEKARAFLQSEVVLPQLSRIPGMKEAASAILKMRCGDGGAIAVYSDFDADGVASAVILEEGLRFLGMDRLTVYFPSRFSEGYGFHPAAVGELVAQGVSLIITADCGITGIDACRKAEKLGCQVVITDHHRPGKELPSAMSVLDPFVGMWEGLGFENLSGAGVAYLLCRALFQEAGIDHLVPEAFAHDLLTLSIAGDGQPLFGLNRLWVKSGLKALGEPLRPGVRALWKVYRGASLPGEDLADLEKASFSPVDYERDVMFGLVPRINAAGRMGDARLAYSLLREKNLAKALLLALQLDDLNSKRRSTEDRILAECSQKLGLKEKEALSQYALCAEDPSWHEGVIGIAASKLREEHFRPSVLLGGEGVILKGSVRGIPGFNVHKALSECGDLLVTFGGHEGAGGFSVKREKVQSFFERFTLLAQKELGDISLEPVLRADDVLEFSSVDQAYLDALRVLEPFGERNPSPLIACLGLSVERVRLLGRAENHVEIAVRGGGEKGDPGGLRRLILFRKKEAAREIALWGSCDVLLSPRRNGEGTSLVLRDIRPDSSFSGQGFEKLLGEVTRGPLLLYTWSPDAGKALYAALSKMGFSAWFHEKGQKGAMAHEARLTLRRMGIVVSTAPWEVYPPGEKAEPLAPVMVLHPPLETYDRELLERFAVQGTMRLAKLGSGLRDLETRLEDLDSWVQETWLRDSETWLELAYPRKESMELMWKFLRKIARNERVLPWELGRRWWDVLELVSEAHPETERERLRVAPYEKAQAFIKGSLRILEELAMVSWDVSDKTLVLSLHMPGQPVSLSHSGWFSRGKMMRDAARKLRQTHYIV